MNRSRRWELWIVAVACAAGFALILGAAYAASPNRTAGTHQEAVAPAHQNKLKVQPDDGVDPDAQDAANPVRENPSGDEEEREAVTAHPGATTGSCGVERWSVKTGTDADASKITLQSTTSSTISYLTSLRARHAARQQPRPAHRNHRLPTSGDAGGIQTGIRLRLPPGTQRRRRTHHDRRDPRPDLCRLGQSAAVQHHQGPQRVQRQVHADQQFQDRQRTGHRDRCRVLRFPARPDRRRTQRHRTAFGTDVQFSGASGGTRCP